MTKKISASAYVLILTLITVLVVCSDATATIYSSISGSVIAEDTGAGLANVTVVASLVGGGHVDYHYASTDARGVYVLKDLNPGTYLIGFYKENESYVNEELHVEVVLPKGKHVVNVNHVLMLGGAVSGTVFESDGTTPMDGIGVYASVSDTQQDWTDNFKYSATGADGKFLLQGLPQTDNCIIETMPPGHARLTKTVKITKGTVTGNVNFTVKSDNVSGINGYIKSSVDGKPIKEAKVNLRDSSDIDIGYTRTDDTGKYSIIGVTPGTYNAVAYWPEGDDWIEKDNIVVEYGKSAVVNFEFNIAAPLSKNTYDIWENFYGLFVPEVFAAAPKAKPLPPLQPDKSCKQYKDEIESASEAIKETVLKNKALCIQQSTSPTATSLREKLENKMKKGVNVICLNDTSNDCKGGRWGKGYNGGTNLRICKWAFDPKLARCRTGMIFHELVHLTQESGPKNEDQAYGCQKSCFFEGCKMELLKEFKNCDASDCR
jgi:hypothetical protein